MQAIKRRMPKEKRASAKRKTVARNAPARKRLTPALRRQQILDAAVRLTVKQGYLPLPIERLALDAGSSKALIYTYFPTQYHIANALLHRELANLKVAGLHTAIQINDLDQALLLSGMLYFEHVVQYGPLLNILTTDLFMSGHYEPALVAQGQAIMQQLVKLALGSLKLPDAEARAAIEMMTALPEEAGSLSFYKELEPAIARQLCHTLILSSLESLRASGKPLARTGNRT